MLTKEDLNAIGTIVDNVVQKRIAPLEIRITQLEKRIARLEVVVNKLRKDIDVAIRFFDKEITSLRRRIERVEETLHLPPLVS